MTLEPPDSPEESFRQASPHLWAGSPPVFYWMRAMVNILVGADKRLTPIQTPGAAAAADFVPIDVGVHSSCGTTWNLFFSL